ncbi:MAG TPA: hypothetical protein VFE33_01195 [Thermoanaerobaculia bacterium]|nr:hypothetical protein [Thermoanaerobaculia bacterium]
MRKLMALVLAPALLAQACASALPPGSPGIPPNLASVNHVVEDQPVTVELRSGEVAREVEGLVMTADSTAWFDGDHARSVPTAEVCKVTLQIRHRAGKGYAWGLLGCAPVALVASHSEADPLDSLGRLLITEAVCALFGILVFSGMRVPPDRVVYTAPNACGPAH